MVEYDQIPTLVNSFQLWLCRTVPSPFSVMRHGPSSNKRPVVELHPGPPIGDMNTVSSVEIKGDKLTVHPENHWSCAWGKPAFEEPALSC